VLDWIKEGKLGPWTIDHFEITKEKAAIYTIGCYGTYEVPPYPGKYTRLVHEKRGVVMSDTRQEMIHLADFRRMLHDATIKIAHINGLGLGICAKLALDAGFTVMVVEIDPDVIELVGKQLLAMYPTGLAIYLGDALQWRPTMGRGSKIGVVWHDIWDVADEDNWEQYKLLMRRWGRFTQFQNAWGRDWILRQKREERSWRYR
jgi:predicted methyltransferase